MPHWTICPVCTDAEASTWIAFPEVEWSQCKTCGVVYKRRETDTLRPENFYEVDYFHGRKSARDKNFPHRVSKCRQQLLAVQEYASVAVPAVLDIGCSFGYVIEAAKQLGMTGAGSDISQYAVKVCKERGYQAEVGTLEEQPFADATFDIVVMKHVLEHTPTPDVALSEVTRLLRGHGLLLIVVPALRYWKAYFRRRTCRYFRPDDLGMQHYVYHTRATLQRLLDRSGYEVLETNNAIFRSKHAKKNLVTRMAELARFTWLTVKQFFAPRMLWQREVFLIARKRS